MQCEPRPKRLRIDAENRSYPHKASDVTSSDEKEPSLINHTIGREKMVQYIATNCHSLLAILAHGKRTAKRGGGEGQIFDF